MSLPIPEAALESHLAILAKTGAGKSYGARGIYEQLLESGARICVIDPTGVHWGIRLSSDGKRAVNDSVLIIGGDHGDLPLDATSGARLGELVASRQMSCVIDVLHLGMGERHRFFTQFANALMRHNRSPLHLVIDECHEFMPQSGYGEKSVDRGKMINAANRLVSAGRARGLRIMLLSQRPAKVHKDSLTQVETLVAMQMIHKLDRDAVGGWVKDCADDPSQWQRIEKTLPRLETGAGWLWAPALNKLEKIQFPRISTYDSFSPASDPGAAAAPQALSGVDLEQIRSQLSETKAGKGETKAGRKTPQQAGGRDDQIVGRNAELEQAVRQLQSRIAADTRAAEALAKSLQKLSAQLQANTEQAVTALAKAVGELTARTEAPRSIPAPAPRQARAQAPAVANGGDDPLVAMARSIWPVRLTWGQLCALCGRKARGGHFNTVRKRLVEDGVVREEGGLVTLTDPPDHSDAVPADVLEQVLPRPARDMFSAIRANPGVMDVQGLGYTLGLQPRGGHWNTGMAMLRTNDLIREDGGVLSINPDLE